MQKARIPNKYDLIFERTKFNFSSNETKSQMKEENNFWKQNYGRQNMCYEL